MPEKDSGRESRREHIVAQAKLSLYPLRGSSWALELNRHKTLTRGKHIAFYTHTGAPQEDEDPKKWQKLHAFI